MKKLLPLLSIVLLISIACQAQETPEQTLKREKREQEYNKGLDSVFHAESEMEDFVKKRDSSDRQFKRTKNVQKSEPTVGVVTWLGSSTQWA